MKYLFEIVYLLIIFFFLDCVLRGFYAIFNPDLKSTFFCSLIGLLFIVKIMIDMYQGLQKVIAR